MWQAAASASGGIGSSSSVAQRFVPLPSAKQCRAATAACREVKVTIAKVDSRDRSIASPAVLVTRFVEYKVLRRIRPIRLQILEILGHFHSPLIAWIPLDFFLEFRVDVGRDGACIALCVVETMDWTCSHFDSFGLTGEMA